MTDFDPTHKFFVGQDVACIDASNPPHGRTPIEVVEGQIYKIAWLGIVKHYIEGEYLGIRVAGIVRPEDDFGYRDLPYRATRFRPLVNDRLAAFRNMLTVSPVNDPYAPSAPEGPRRTRKLPVRAPSEREKVEVK